MYDRFCVGIGVERVAASVEVFPQFLVIVDLAVENDPFFSVGAVHRLMPAGQVDDRQPAHREACSAVKIKSVVIRSAMTYRSVHAAKHIPVRGFTAAIYKTRNSAHSIEKPLAITIPELARRFA